MRHFKDFRLIGAGAFTRQANVAIILFIHLINFLKVSVFLYWDQLTSMPQSLKELNLQKHAAKPGWWA